MLIFALNLEAFREPSPLSLPLTIKRDEMNYVNLLSVGTRTLKYREFINRASIVVCFEYGDT